MSAVPAVNRSAPVAPRVRQRPQRLIDVGPGPAVAVIGHNSDPQAEAAPAVDQPSDEVINAVTAFVRANVAANKAKNDADKAKKTMEKLVEQSDHTNFAVEVDGKTWDITNLESASEAIDASKLKAAVDQETFMKIVERLIKSARGGKGAVEEIAGSSIANRCLATATKPAEVRIKERK